MTYNVKCMRSFCPPPYYISKEEKGKNLGEVFRKRPNRIHFVIGCIALLGDSLLADKPAKTNTFRKRGNLRLPGLEQLAFGQVSLVGNFSPTSKIRKIFTSFLLIHFEHCRAVHIQRTMKFILADPEAMPPKQNVFVPNASFDFARKRFHVKPPDVKNYTNFFMPFHSTLLLCCVLRAS